MSIQDRDFAHFVSRIEQAFVNFNLGEYAAAEVNGQTVTFFRLNDAGRGLLNKVTNLEVEIPRVMPTYNLKIEIERKADDGTTDDDSGHGDGSARVDQAVGAGGDPGSV